MKQKFYLVTGGSGFIGSALVRRLVGDGHRVRVFDNNSRGSLSKLGDIVNKVDFVQGDIRDAAAVAKAVAGVDCVCHLAYVNGTKYFYSVPHVVLDVAVKGMVNVLDACIAHKVREFVLASSSEVYQTAEKIPTDESARLVVPDPLNPRYTYGSGKIICEMMAIHYGKKFFDRVLIFRPHNVFGADMGWEHVVPEFITRLWEMSKKSPGALRFPIQGSGKETRSFVYIDDFTDGLACMIEKGEHLGIYHIGTEEEISISQLALWIAECMGLQIELAPGKLTEGSTMRRCPDIAKLRGLGYAPKFLIRQALPAVVKWYTEHYDQYLELQKNHNGELHR